MFKLTFKQQVLTGFAITLTCVFVSAFFSFFSIKALNESSNWIEHTYEVINTAEKAKTSLLNAETGLRGYVITQTDSYKRPYNNSIDEVQSNLNQLGLLIKDNPQQTKRIDSLKFYAQLKVEDMRKIMAKAITLGFEAAKQQVLTNEGQLSKNNYLRVNNDFVNTELRLLKERKDQNNERTYQTTIIVVSSSILIFGLVLFLLSYIRRTFDQQKETERQILLTNAELAQLSALNEHNNWLLSGAAEINEAFQGQQEIEELTSNILSKICTYIDASVGALFLLDEKSKALRLTGSYAYAGKNVDIIRLGEGLVGQIALAQQPKLISDIPKDYLKIKSGLGNTDPGFLFLVPIVFERQTIAVIELGFLQRPQDNKLQLIDNVTENIGIAINSALAHLQLRDLFEQTQQQAEELESQQEELRTTNEELSHKTHELQVSEEELRVQQEELQQTNAELEEKAQLLEERNVLINEAKEAIVLKAEELELSSKYKSEFLANMSHELRTPLNSILILARILKENKHENLSEEQVKYANVIQNAGNDLLTLINDILDLSKIETGNIDLHIEKIKPSQVANNLELLFSELANHKKMSFEVRLADNLPTDFASDLGRLEQIIKNLLSNAFKFTPENGKITLHIDLVKPEFARHKLKESNEEILSFSVSDTGIGIAADKLQVIFEAFKQEDGSTSRKYGGTGLGLSISRELANLLGGEIQVKSKQGAGSTFTLLIPQHHAPTVDQLTQTMPPQVVDASVASIAPLQEELNQRPSSNLLLIIEDDVDFADILKSYAIDKGFEPVLAHTGDQGLEMATSLLPDAIILDIMLPIMDGWAVLKALKSNPTTQNIPVHMMSADNDKETKAKKEGAIGFLKKPLEQAALDEAFQLWSMHHAYPFRNVLVVEDQVLQNNNLTDQLIQKEINVAQAYTGKEALLLLETQHFDCIILDLKLPDISGFDLLDQIKSEDRFKHIPVIINTAMELDREKMLHIMQYTEAMVLKSDKSNDRLLDEVSLFINKLQQSGTDIYVPPAAVKSKQSNTLEKALKDKTILVTDDDMRNIFALSSALQAYQINILIANNGVEALEKIKLHPEINLVLMDIMMPEMDGYEAMRQIRAQKQFANLPIIALTAKAMKNDREKCIEAGANDYISKPVDVDKLLSMLRVWLS